jgi:tetratricopeptide (TPR) repeat protein
MKPVAKGVALGAFAFALMSGAAFAKTPTVAELIARYEAETAEGKLDKAEATAKEALALARKGNNPLEIGDALDAVCQAGVALTGFGAGEPCTAAYEHRLATVGKGHFKTYAAQAALANAYFDSDPDRAIAMTREAAENMEKLATTPDQKTDAGAAWYMVALALKFKGDYLASLPLFEKAATIMGAPDATPNVALAGILTDHADTLIVLGDYDNARVLAARAVDIRERMQGAGHSDLADTLGVLGDALRRMGRYDEAEAYFRRSLRIAENATPPLPQILGRAYQNLGLAYVFSGRYDEALDMQLKAVEVLKTMGDNGDLLLSSVYNDLANTYNYRGDYRKSMEASELALAIILKQHDRKFDRSLSLLTVLASVKFKAGDTVEARALIDEVVETRVATAPTSARTADALMLRATMRIDDGDHAGARADLEQAAKIIAPLSPNSSLAIRVNSLLAGELMDTDPHAAYDLAVKGARSQAYVLANMERVQAAIGGLQTPADRREIFDTVLDAAWRKTHAITSAK